ncbi:MAG: hypothetical protein A2Z12_03605 [Actinobacteria bacterium RBG_16_68_21]|nr:MAG: hypothetical protein A2Z12_03605 [Actinobacteria bacterium RBG_16_68_21]
MDVSPSIVLATWAGGVAAATAVVGSWRIVGPGFSRLAAAVTLGLGIPAALGSSTAWDWVGCSCAAAAFIAAGGRSPVVWLMGAAAAGFVAAAAIDGVPVAAVSGGLLLGGVTSTMILGHWYLVDPRLPRRALRTLDAAGALGMVVDFGVLAIMGAIPWEWADAAFGAGFVLLAVTTTVLMTAVWFALGETGYSGVMAATGLSYLAVLTAFGSAVLGRILAG